MHKCVSRNQKHEAKQRKRKKERAEVERRFFPLQPLVKRMSAVVYFYIFVFKGNFLFIEIVVVLVSVEVGPEEVSISMWAVMETSH